METPFYLSNDVSQQNQGDLLFQIPIFSSPNLTGVQYTPEQMGGVWESLKDSTSGLIADTTNYVFDSANNVWTKTTSALSDTISDTFSTIRNSFLLLLGVGLVIIWVVAKSGILTQSAQVLGGLAALK